MFLGRVAFVVLCAFLLSLLRVSFVASQMCQEGMLDVSGSSYQSIICSVSNERYENCADAATFVGACDVEGMHIAQEEAPTSETSNGACAVEKEYGTTFVVLNTDFTSCCEDMGGTVETVRDCSYYDQWLVGLTSYDQCSELIYGNTTYAGFIESFAKSSGWSCCTDNIGCCDEEDLNCGWVDTFVEVAPTASPKAFDLATLCEFPHDYNADSVFSGDGNDTPCSTIMSYLPEDWADTCDSFEGTLSYIRQISIAECCSGKQTVCNVNAQGFCADPEDYKGGLTWEDDGGDIVSCDQVVYTYFGDDLDGVDCEGEATNEVMRSYSESVYCCGKNGGMTACAAWTGSHNEDEPTPELTPGPTTSTPEPTSELTPEPTRPEPSDTRADSRADIQHVWSHQCAYE